MDALTRHLDEAGLRKAAVFVASLDPSVADALLDQLNPEQAALLRQTAATLDEIGASERRRVIDEFRRIQPMVPQPYPEGIDLDGLPLPSSRASGQTLADLASDQDLLRSEDRRTTEALPSPFGFLQDADDEALTALLGAERPAAVAVVLSHLSPQRAGEVLARLSPGTQVEVVRRLVDLQNTDEETVRELERVLESRWSRLFALPRRAAMKPDAMNNILASCDERIRGKILGNLVARDHLLAERFGCRPLTFEDLFEFDDARLAAIVRAAEPEVVLAAFLGATPAMVARILRCLTPAEAKHLKCKLDRPGPIRLSDVEEARKQMAVLAQRLVLGDFDPSSFAA